MTRQTKGSFWTDFRTGFAGFEAAENGKDQSAHVPATFAVTVSGATGPFAHLNGAHTLRKPPGEANQTWVTDDKRDGFYLMSSTWRWRLQQGDTPDFSSGWKKDGPTGTFLLRGIGRAEGQTFIAEVAVAD